MVEGHERYTKQVLGCCRIERTRLQDTRNAQRLQLRRVGPLCSHSAGRAGRTRWRYGCGGGRSVSLRAQGIEVRMLVRMLDRFRFLRLLLFDGGYGGGNPRRYIASHGPPMPAFPRRLFSVTRIGNRPPQPRDRGWRLGARALQQKAARGGCCWWPDAR